MTRVLAAALAVFAAAAPARALDLESHFGSAANETKPAPVAGHIVLAQAPAPAPIVEATYDEAQAIERLLNSYLRRDWGGFAISGGRLYAAPIDEGRWGRRRVDAVEIYRGFQNAPLTIELRVNRPDVAASLSRELPFSRLTNYGLYVYTRGPIESTTQFEQARAALVRVLTRAWQRTGGWRGAEGERQRFKRLADWGLQTRVALPRGGQSVAVERIVTAEERARLGLNY